MKKVLKVVVVILAAIFIAIQFFRPTFSNPPIIPGQPIEDSAHVPAEVQMLLSRSCNDCHSNKTIYPWYTQIAPVSWLLDSHIDAGRTQLNFSEWNTYSVNRKAHKLEEICEMVESGAMPMGSYLWMHGDADLSADQTKLLCDWAKEERAKLPEE
jgi:hypothetical protein